MTRSSGAVAESNPTVGMRFRWPWRPYQARVLEAAERSLRDGRIHIVAAPGAGKTSLGLELFRSLSRPAVVFAPTLTIRDQWVRRVSDFVVDNPDARGWISTDLKQPGFLTVVTYQALHARLRTDATDGDSDGEPADPAPSMDELTSVVERLTASRVGTVILDEAHHLRREWWKALSALLGELPDVRLVSLTATPPYDVIGKEWRRYEELCGPIDEHIGAPELVRLGTLCPHQDYVWAVFPSPEDATTVRKYDAAVEALCRDELEDPALLAAVVGHPFVSVAGPYPTDVFDTPELAFALLVFLKASGRELPRGPLELLRCSVAEIPALDRRWWEVLLKAYLDDAWPNPDERHRAALRRRLHADGILERGELRIRESRAVRVSLASSESKVGACVTLSRLERRFRGEALRQVVLTDFIREGDARRLGAWSIFARIVGDAEPAERSYIALTTGRLVIVHESLKADFVGAEFRPIDRLEGFLEVTTDRAVEAITRLLESGKIRILVGTKALLGEGWDAPCVNSLVIASYVGSFMLTNQMRGRALRTDPAQPNKSSSIWHLVAVEPDSPSGAADLDRLKLRFETFVGIADTADRIEAGLDRLELPAITRVEDVDPFNDESQRRLIASASLAERWRASVGGDADRRRVVPAVVSTSQPEIRRFVFAYTIRALLYTSSLAFLSTFSATVLKSLGAARGGLGALFALAAGAGAIVTFPNLVLAARLARRHAPVDGSIRQIARAVLDALCETGAIRSERSLLEVTTPEIEPGVFSIGLSGGTYPEAAVFADSVEEVLAPIENPRYLVTRESRGRWFGLRVDYHAVPYKLAARDTDAETFARAWRSHVGGTTLFPTRTEWGRQVLLRARAKALSTQYIAPAFRRDRWQ